MTSFSALNLPAPLLQNLATLSFHEMTEVQSLSLPPVLDGRDVIVQAKTGSGKTAAFGLGLLNRLDPGRFQIQALVLCPTRELADQVAQEIRRLARQVDNVKIVTLCGGVSIGPQIGSLEYGAHIVVGTPGRILKHLSKGTLKLEQVETLVLDEADRMLDMGFFDDIEAIIESTPKSRQTLLFSATYPPEIEHISSRFMNKAETITADVHHEPSVIEEYFFEISHGDRLSALGALLSAYPSESAIIFCNTKRDCADVASGLKNLGFIALALHGDLDQKTRDETLIRFSNQSCAILVATDVAARGLDVDSLGAVINYEVTKDAEVHVHRSGRTGRAGQKGLVLNLVTERERHRVSKIEAYAGFSAQFRSMPKSNNAHHDSYQPQMVTLQIDGGRKQKLRPGDIVGALTADGALNGDQLGKINLTHNKAFVAVQRSVAKKALVSLQQGKIKNRQFKARRIG